MILNNIEIAVQHKNIKSIHLSVYPPHADVKISAPFGTSESYIKNFALSKWTWITEKRSQILASCKESKEKEYVSGESHLLFGSEYRLLVLLNPHEKENAFIDGDYIKVSVKKKDNVKDVLEDFYKAQLTGRIERFVSKWEEILKVKCEKIKYRTMKTRWGSCIPAKKLITFNISFAQKAPRMPSTLLKDLQFMSRHPRFWLKCRSNKDGSPKYSQSQIEEAVSTLKKTILLDKVSNLTSVNNKVYQLLINQREEIPTFFTTVQFIAAASDKQLGKKGFLMEL